jgi:hypothetical protein
MCWCNLLMGSSAASPRSRPAEAGQPIANMLLQAAVSGARPVLAYQVGRLMQTVFSTPRSRNNHSDWLGHLKDAALQLTSMQCMIHGVQTMQSVFLATFLLAALKGRGRLQDLLAAQMDSLLACLPACLHAWQHK